MAMTLFDPFADMTRLRQQIDRLVQDATPDGRTPENARGWRPAVDVYEDNDGFVLQMDVPEADQEKLDIQLTGDELVIRGERRWKAPQTGALVHSERAYGQFQRVFRLGVPLQHDAVQASYRNGVLSVRLPKAETVKPRKVAISLDGEG